MPDSPTPAPTLGAMPSNPAPAENPLGGGVDPAPAPAAAPAPSSVVIPENWKDALSEEFRKDSSLESIKSVEDLTKSYIHAQKLVGRDKVVVPDPKFATDQDWAAFFQKVGQPKELKDYQIEAPKGEILDPAFLNDFKENAHKLNILPAQAQKLLHWYAEKEKALVEEATAHQNQVLQKGLEDYKTKVGAAFEKKVTLANRTLQKFGGPEVQKWMQENPSVGSSPHMIEMLAKLGEHLYSEDTFDGSEKIRGAMTPQEATSEINTIYGDKNHPYFQKGHPKHDEAVAHMRKLFQFQNPG